MKRSRHSVFMLAAGLMLLATLAAGPTSAPAPAARISQTPAPGELARLLDQLRDPQGSFPDQEGIYIRLEELGAGAEPILPQLAALLATNKAWLARQAIAAIGTEAVVPFLVKAAPK